MAAYWYKMIPPGEKIVMDSNMMLFLQLVVAGMPCFTACPLTFFGVFLPDSWSFCFVGLSLLVLLLLLLLLSMLLLLLRQDVRTVLYLHEAVVWHPCVVLWVTNEHCGTIGVELVVWRLERNTNENAVHDQ